MIPSLVRRRRRVLTGQAGRERRLVELDGRPLRVWSAGRRSGAPPIVMVAGLGYPGMLFPWMQVAARWTEVTLLDLPGWRHQRAVSCRPTVEDMATAAASWLLDGGGPPAVLIGHSTGAQAALRTAVQVPARLAGLVMVGPTLDPAARTWPRLLARFVRPLWREHPAEIPAVAGSMIAAGISPVATLISSALADRPEQAVLDLRVPALIIVGRHDRVASPAWSKRLADAADAPCHILPGGHNCCFPYASAADRLVRDAVAAW